MIFSSSLIVLPFFSVFIFLARFNFFPLFVSNFPCQFFIRLRALSNPFRERVCVCVHACMRACVYACKMVAHEIIFGMGSLWHGYGTWYACILECVFVCMCVLGTCKNNLTKRLPLL